MHNPLPRLPISIVVLLAVACAIALSSFLSPPDLSGALEAHAREMRTGAGAQLRVLQQICSHTATTSEERAACWSSRP